mgnify:CR=1 FL=1
MTRSILMLFVVTPIFALAEGKMPFHFMKNDNVFQGIITIGFNTCQIDGDGPTGYNYIGALGGIGTNMKFSKNTSFSMELLYSMRGSVQRRILEKNPQEVFKISTDYIEVPLCLNIKYNKAIAISGGLSPGVLIRYKSVYQYYDYSGLPQNSYAPICLIVNPRKYDISAVGGIDYFIKEHFSIGARFLYSLIGIRPTCIGRSRARAQFHNMISFKLTYNISNK